MVSVIKYLQNLGRHIMKYVLLNEIQEVINEIQDEILCQIGYYCQFMRHWPITEMTIYIKYDVCEIGNMILHIVANLLNLLNFRIRYFIISTIDVVLELPMSIQ